jgi:uncharacterized protein YdaU (DUF1376 family)
MSKAKRKTDIWISWYVGDYLRDTMHLSCLEHGAYRQLLDRCYMEGGCLKDDNDQLARTCKLPLREWMAIRNTIKPFFRCAKGWWYHDRVIKELAAAKLRSENARHAINCRWNNRGDTGVLPETHGGDTGVLPEGYNSHPPTHPPSQPVVPVRVPNKKENLPTGGLDGGLSRLEFDQFCCKWPGNPGEGIPAITKEGMDAVWAELAAEDPQPKRWRKWVVAVWGRLSKEKNTRAQDGCDVLAAISSAAEARP